MDLQHDARLSLFEVTIRIVGGLLAAFDACGEAVFLTKADELASKMLDNFKSTEQGVRDCSTDLHTDLVQECPALPWKQNPVLMHAQ